MSADLTFVLVPGASHGAWCWERVVNELTSRGFSSVALDLPCEDETAGAREYADHVLKEVAELNGEIVLVGHSLGGLTIPIVAAEISVRRLIFIAGVLPVPGLSLTEQKLREPNMIFPNLTGSLRDRYYNAATNADATWALGHLRPQAQKPYDEITPLAAWPPAPSTAIISTDDHVVNYDWARKAWRERHGVDPVVLDGADHSPFLSRPAELAEILALAAD